MPLLPFASAPGSGGGVTNVTGTAPVVSSGGATPAISVTSHGGTARVQLSDNTGTSGNLAKFAANGDVTDGGIAATAVLTTTLLNYQKAAGALTGNGADQTIYTYTLPGGTMAAGKGIRVVAMWNHSTGTASITYKLFYGATSITLFGGGVSTAGVISCISHIFNDPAATNAQQLINSYGATGSTARAPVFGTAAIDSTANAAVTITFNVANTDQVTPNAFIVELV